MFPLVLPLHSPSSLHSPSNHHRAHVLSPFHLGDGSRACWRASIWSISQGGRDWTSLAIPYTGPLDISRIRRENAFRSKEARQCRGSIWPHAVSHRQRRKKPHRQILHCRYHARLRSLSGPHHDQHICTGHARDSQWLLSLCCTSCGSGNLWRIFYSKGLLNQVSAGYLLRFEQPP